MIASPPSVRAEVDAHPYPLVFATISGAHLYGFASPDSDWDIRGVHVLPLAAVAGLDRGEETIERMRAGPPELDVVTHDAAKFMRLLLKPNGYVLEQLLSPLVVATTPAHDELRRLGRACVTKHHVRHYKGFAMNQWDLFRKETPPRVKPLLYVFRVLLTGIHLLRTGEVEANLGTLNEEFRLPWIDDLIARKRAGSEHERLTTTELATYEAEYQRLLGLLLAAGETAHLREEPEGRAELNELLLRLRGVRYAETRGTGTML
jgi:hypothetical protein